MLPDINAWLEESQVPYTDSVIGAAVFDLSGLPKEYFTTAESSDISWVQAIFQALGLQSLLMSSLRLDGFNHATVHGKIYCAVVVRQKARYMALLIQKNDVDAIAAPLIQWMQSFEPSSLKSTPRFSTV